MMFHHIESLKWLSCGVDFCSGKVMVASTSSICWCLKFGSKYPGFFRYSQEYAQNQRLNQFKNLDCLGQYVMTSAYQNQDRIFKIELVFYLKLRYGPMVGCCKSCFSSFQSSFQLLPTFWITDRNLKKIHRERTIAPNFIDPWYRLSDTPFHYSLQSCRLIRQSKVHDSQLKVRSRLQGQGRQQSNKFHK